MFVFIKKDRDPKLVYLFSSYEENTNTQAIEWQGKKVCALFLHKVSAKYVALMQGWQEITQEYEESLKKDQEIETPKTIEIEIEPKRKTSKK